MFAHPEKLPSFIVQHGEPTLSISSLAMNLNYTTVPVTITAVPASELLGIDDYWDSLIQHAQESGGVCIFTRADVRCGDLVPSGESDSSPCNSTSRIVTGSVEDLPL